MMSEDIRKWTDGRYTLMFDEHTFFVFDNEKEKQMTALQVTKKLNEQQATIEQLESDKAIAEDYANIFEMENVKLRKKLNNYKATVLGFIWIMEQNGRISGKDDDFVKDLFKLIE